MAQNALSTSASATASSALRPAPSAVATASIEPEEMNVSSSICAIPSAGRITAQPLEIARLVHQFGQRQVAARRVLAPQLGETLRRCQRILDHPDAVGPLGMPRAGSHGSRSSAG